jgi:Fe-S cluster assembly protein SufD
MDAILDKFTPSHSEAWRFSGFKGLNDVTRTAVFSQVSNVQKFEVDSARPEVVRLEAVGGICARKIEILAKSGADLNFVLINDLPELVQNFNFIDISAQTDAKVNFTILNFGSVYTRQEISAKILGAGAQVRLRSLSIVGGSTEVDQRTLQLHAAPDAFSDLLFKNILDGSAHTIFSGMIDVAPEAARTDAYQRNANLVLSAAAQAHALPGLEIKADDVKCSHGATVGSLDPSQLFYLRSRGIDEETAKRMLMAGFCEEILAGLPESVQPWARNRLSRDVTA